MSQLFIGINLLNIVGNMGGGGLSSRRHLNGGLKAPTGGGSGEGYPVYSGMGAGAPEKNFDFVLRNVQFLCIRESGSGR